MSIQDDVKHAAGLHEPWSDAAYGPLGYCCECLRVYPCLTARTLRMVYVNGVLTRVEEK